jgi:uncharacterized C2H2 Zn-finger protein
METEKILRCSYCDYTTIRNYNLKRHEINKHSKEILNENGQNSFEKNTVNDNKNYSHCSKCYKKYLTPRSLKNHEEKCIGIDILTCPKCMNSFSDSSNKIRHMKRNSCKAKSIIHARQPNIQNIETQNNITNITNNIINNTFVINNYGNERLDYLSEDDMLKILTSGNNTIPLYIEKKHFNKDFPENNNIQYDDKSKKCKIKENNKWKNMNLSMASSKLINDNSLALLTYFDTNKELLNKQIKNNEIYDFIIEKLLYIKNKSDKEQYNNLFNIIKFLIEGSNNLII